VLSSKGRFKHIKTVPRYMGSETSREPQRLFPIATHMPDSKLKGKELPAGQVLPFRQDHDGDFSDLEISLGVRGSTALSQLRTPLGMVALAQGAGSGPVLPNSFNRMRSLLRQGARKALLARATVTPRLYPDTDGA
jgi:hypothetical protein